MLLELEHTAVEFARLASAEIMTALHRTLSVRYKTAAQSEYAPTDPVSEVDQRVEELIRNRLAERYPAHDIIGEEIITHPGAEHDVVWVIDPIDGTGNFINGFPLFAASIGVLYQGYPVAGALWCSTSHALRPGVYHAHSGGWLCFDGEAFVPRPPNVTVKRYLAGDPGDKGLDPSIGWDIRTTGSAAIECAFVAAGLLRAAWFRQPNLWDIAAGVTLVQVAGREVWTRSGEDWTPLNRFVPDVNTASERFAPLRAWRQDLLLGDADAVAQLRRDDQPAVG
jgi:myo-inositol-1(or 4)-monophosphatase